MNMTNALHQLIDIGNCMGSVEGVHMYDKDFLSVEGKTNEGKKFSLTVHVKEEEKNGN